tara:strand:+ start:254 stop:589 length:336 start_codon:yes stop_codon:yes gene_type:complete
VHLAARDEQYRPTRVEPQDLLDERKDLVALTGTAAKGVDEESSSIERTRRGSIVRTAPLESRTSKDASSDGIRASRRRSARLRWRSTRACCSALSVETAPPGGAEPATPGA